MKYKVYREFMSTYEPVEAGAFKMEGSNATFYWELPGIGQTNVAFYSGVSKIEQDKQETKQQNREKKLKRILRKDNFFISFLKKIIN